MKRKMFGILMILFLLSGLMSVSVPVFAAEVYPTLIAECFTSEPSGAITKDLSLPSEWEGVGVTWQSSNENVLEIDAVNKKAVVHRPVADTKVILTATLNSITSKEFEFTVLNEDVVVHMSDNFYYPSLKDQQITTTPLAKGTKAYGYTLTGAYNGYYQMSIADNPRKSYDYALKSQMLTANNSVYPAGEYYLNGTPNGIVYLKTSMMSVSNSMTTIRGYASNAQSLFALNFYNSSRSVALSDGGANAVEDAAHKIWLPNEGNWFDLEIKIDFPQGKYTVIANNSSLTMNLSSQPGANYLGKLTFTPYRNATSALYMDDLVIKSYKIGGTAEEALAKYRDKLTLDLLTTDNAKFILKDLNLNVLQQYSDAFSVAWSSGNQGALTIDAVNKKAVIHSSYLSQPVTLTATITHEGLTATKSFDISVRAAGEQIAVNENFDGYTANIGSAIPKESSTGTTPGTIPGSGWRYYNTTTTLTDTIEADAQKGLVLHLNRNTATSGTDGLLMRSFSWETAKGLYGTRATGNFVSLSMDLKFTQPEGLDSSNTIYLYTSATSFATIQFRYENNGFVPYYYAKNSTFVKAPNYDNVGIPAAGEWFHMEVKANMLSKTYDFYINTKKVNNKAIDFVGNHTGQTGIVMASFLVDTRYEDGNMYINDLRATQSNASWTNADADLSSAVIFENLQGLPSVGTLYSSAITWTVSGDATQIVGGNVVIPQGYGKGTAVLTATATTSSSATAQRIFVVSFDKITPVMIQTVVLKDSDGNTVSSLTDGGTLESITVSASQSGTGYIGLFENGILKDVKKITVANGVNNVNYALPASVAGCEIKIFVWNNDMKPLSDFKSFS